MKFVFGFLAGLLAGILAVVGSIAAFFGGLALGWKAFSDSDEPPVTDEEEIT